MGAGTTKNFPEQSDIHVKQQRDRVIIKICPLS